MDTYNPFLDPTWDGTSPPNQQTQSEKNPFLDPQWVANQNKGNFARGFEVGMRQVPQTFGGAVGMLGNAVGSSGLRDWGMDVYKGQEDKIKSLSRDSDSISNVAQGKGDFTDWLGYGAGYTGAQALQAVATGGVGGFVAKGVAKIGIEQAAKAGAEQLVKEGVEQAAAKQMAKQALLDTAANRGQTAALYGSNLMQEAGSIYSDALDQAKQDGRLQADGGLSGADLARAAGSAAAAAGVDTAMESKILGGVFHGSGSTDKNIVKRVLKSAGKTAAQEAATEGVQTGIERFGAQQSLGDKEAVTDYIDSAAMGALGGAMGGAPAGLHPAVDANAKDKPNANQPPAAPNAEAPLLLGNTPDPLVQFKDGTVARQSEIEAYTATLPDDQKAAFTAKLLGYAPQQADAKPLTTSLGATDFNGGDDGNGGGGGGGGTKIQAPSLTTSLGAQDDASYGNSIDYKQKLDTGGLRLVNQNSPFSQPVPQTTLDTQALAAQGAYPVQKTPAPVLDPKRFSQQLGISHDNGGLEKAAAVAVDSGAAPITQHLAAAEDTAQTPVNQQPVAPQNGTQTQETQQTGAGQPQAGAAQDNMADSAPRVRAVKTKGGGIVHVNEADLTSGASTLRTFTPDGKPSAIRLKAADIAPAAAPVVLQNRNRTSTASIAQVNSIASNPDYLRLGVSNTMDTGAPVVFGQLPHNIALGKRQQIADGNGKRTNVQYAVVDANDLITSHDASGNANPSYENGEPNKFRVVAGNGRAEGERTAYERGTAGNYVSELSQDAANHGIPQSEIQKFAKPVLVRIMNDADITSDIGDRSNIQAGLQKNAVEQATDDTRRVDIRGLEFDDNGNPTPSTVKQFMANMPIQEHGNMLDSKGQPTVQLMDRIRAAAFKQAYSNDALVELATQSTSPESRNVLNGLAMTAGNMAKLSGTGEFDIRQAVADAAGVAVTAARRGESLADYMRTVQIDENPETIIVLQFMAENVKSAKKIAEGLRDWADLAQRQVEVARGNAEQGSMFGDTPTLPRRQLFERLNNGNITEIEQQQLAEKQRRAELAKQGAERANAESAGNADSAGDGTTSGGTEPASRAEPAAEPTSGQQSDFALEQQTPEQLKAQEEAKAQAEREQAQADARAAEQERQAKERQEVTQRSEQAADNFQLGQSAEDNLSGQGDIFAQQPEPAPQPKPTNTKEAIAQIQAKKAAEKADKEAKVFIKAPSGGLDYGEITPEMAAAMRRQAGKIRLRQGNDAWGLTHIQNRHLEQFKRLGFDSAESFIASVAKDFTAVYQRKGAALDVVLSKEGTGQRLVVQLEPSADGDFYEVKTASPVRSDQFKNEKPLWERIGTNAPSADNGSSPFPKSQSGNASVAAEQANGKPTEPTRPAKWRSDSAQAAIVAKELGIKVGKNASATELVKAIDAHDAKARGESVEAAPAPKKDVALSVGAMPKTAEPVTVKDGVVYIGKDEAINYDTGEPVTVPKGSTRDDVANALKDAGALSSKQRVFGLGEQAGSLAYSRKADNTVNESGKDGQKQSNAKQIPEGLPAARTVYSANLERAINDDLERGGQPTGFRAESVSRDSLPNAIRSALGGFERATGTKVVVFRNLTPEIHDFEGVTTRNGVLYVNESSAHPVTAVAAHEWLHNMRKTHPELYASLAQEVEKQGDATGFAKKYGYAEKHGTEELTAAAVGDAMTDPAFLQRLAQRNQGVFRQVARAFLDFLNTLTAKMRGQGSEAFMSDVGAFRDKLAAVLDLYEKNGGKADAAVSGTAFQMVWHGTPHRGIEQTGFKLNKIGTGEGVQVYGHGIYFAQARDVAESYRKSLGHPELVVDGKVIPWAKMTTAQAGLAGDIAAKNGNLSAVLSVYKKHGGETNSLVKERLDALNELGGSDVTTRKGQLYKADIPENHELLDWDKPLSEQPAQVQKAIEKIKRSVPKEMRWMVDGIDKDTTGKDIYGSLGDLAAEMNHDGVENKQQAGSELLLEHGIPGLRYLDGVSRTASSWKISSPTQTVSGKWMVKDSSKPNSKGLLFDTEEEARAELAKHQEETHNYVVWDESRLSPDAAKIEAMYSRSKQASETGHAQPLDEPVLTPTGWRPIGELQIGDEVLAADGSVTHITGVYPQGEQEVFRVELDDGRWTRATKEHLWQLAIDEGGAVTIAQTQGLAVGDALPVVV